MAETRSGTQGNQGGQATTGRMFDTRHDLGQADREAVIRMMNVSLADSTDLFTMTKHAHWNVKGMNFWQLHELFDELADTVRAHSDTIAERITALGGQAMGTLRLAGQATRLADFPLDVVEDHAVVEALADRYARHAAQLRQGIDEAEEHHDKATADLYTEVVRDIDKALYFLESHLQVAARR